MAPGRKESRTGAPRSQAPYLLCPQCSVAYSAGHHVTGKDLEELDAEGSDQEDYGRIGLPLQTLAHSHVWQALPLHFQASQSKA